MSYIRFGGTRWFSDDPGHPLYAYSTIDGSVRIHTGMGKERTASVTHEDWIEITLRMLRRQLDDSDMSDEIIETVEDLLTAELIDKRESVDEELSRGAVITPPGRNDHDQIEKNTTDESDENSDRDD